MSESVSNHLIDKINTVLQSKHDCTVNIVNDKLTLSVFSFLRDNLQNVREINFIIRDTRSLPETEEVAREFEIDIKSKDMLFNQYDIIEKNKLAHFATAKAMYNFIKQHVNVRITRPPHNIRGNLLTINDDFMVQGSSSLEISNKATQSRTINVDFDAVLNDTMDKSQIEGANTKFEQLWYSNELTRDFKEELLKTLLYVYKDHCPEFLYYFTLNEIFGNQLDYGVERFERDNTQFKKTDIWKALFDFQKDAVLSAIQKINKYNGCIIADSVGLGKTFEALAVIKYFELRQDNVLVLTPAKLFDNWNSFRNPYKDNIINDIFNYKILCHTDLSRYEGESRSGIDLSRIDWSKFDLVVIDESHNFRNRIMHEDRITRYERLLGECIKNNQNTKVLLLSATPVNNSLKDLRNQINLLAGDCDDAFSEHGIESISATLTNTQSMITYWYKNRDHDKRSLVDTLPPNFFRLLEMVTIARSRKQITTGYKSKEFGKFPDKLKPQTFEPDIDKHGKLLIFDTTNKILESLKMAVYSPMKYIKSEQKQYYHEKFQTTYGDKVIFTQEIRELNTTTLHRFNLFKRLESSVYAFGETIGRLINRIEKAIKQLESIDSDKILEVDELDDEDDFLDYKYEININHLNAADFLVDLHYDKEILDGLNRDIRSILDEKRDYKLEVLREFLHEKITTMPYNNANRKVLIFSAFADTADYLFSQLKNELKELGVYTAFISGSRLACSNNKIHQDFSSLLHAFSPISKRVENAQPELGIDVLIGTDCISEGQNLQDCDCVVNYDIQWNPVVLIQRFGRIDRIGSRNAQIQMVNFFPNVKLNEYLNLEQRIKGKMLAVNLASTGEEDILSPEMNDIRFRKRLLEKLKQEVIDIDEANENISLTDLNMNDYLFELVQYIKKNPDVKIVPKGIYSVTEGEKKGVLFCFKHSNIKQKPNSDSSLYPYYLIYIGGDGEVIYGNLQAREALKEFRKLCVEKDIVNALRNSAFLKRTNNAKNMGVYSKLLTKAVESIQGDESKKAQESIFSFSGFNNPFASETADDFELISFLIVD
ncbi:MAG: DEAD/DEAH box helicase family protein [Fibromonadaceae bacterium]|jgi:ERCC4-related helicase|nr:DEAD/DEAH box helicase family protein [Fibromonadaceae bacterium]